MENTTTQSPTEKKGNIEDLVAWQKAKELATTAYRLVNATNADDILKEKMIDSVLEVSYSIARSYGVKQRVQSLENLYQAREAIFEFKTAFSIAVDLGMVGTEKTADIQPLIDHTDKLVSGLIQYKEDARKGKVRKPFQSRGKDVDGNSIQNNDNYGNSVDYTSSPVSNF
ncbi:MAG TPA: four helix bundle protein [Bacteroidia bacterium]|nr:four helix bundle protein [Bacteroidia bacterium]